jgi:AraC-like DNA-binding protein
MKTSLGLRVSFAEDAGGIELIHAHYRGHRIEPHFHEEFSISVTLRGGLAFEHRGSKHIAPSGIISAINPAELHNARAAGGEDWAFLCFLIPAPVLRTLTHEALDQDRLPAFRDRVITDAPLVGRLIRLHRILELSIEPLERESLYLSTFAQLIQSHSTAAHETPAIGQERAAVRRARDLLHDCYIRPVSLTELAANAGLSRFHLLRVFRAEVGLTPHVYINHLRVQEAKRMLACGHSIAEAALLCGFADQSHLTRRFKQILGFTPGQYQMALPDQPRHVSR